MLIDTSLSTQAERFFGNLEPKNKYGGGKVPNLQSKQQVIDEIISKIKSAQGICLVDYRGITVEKDTDLRKKFREAGVEYKVYKNTMMRFAFKECGLEDFNQYLAGPSAIAFSATDATAPARVAAEFAKTEKKFELKAGVVEGQVYDAKGIAAIAEIPSRDVLLSMLLSALQGNLRNLAYALNSVKEQKEAN